MGRGKKMLISKINPVSNINSKNDFHTLPEAVLFLQKKTVSGVGKWYKFRKAFITSQRTRKYAERSRNKSYHIDIIGYNICSKVMQ